VLVPLQHYLVSLKHFEDYVFVRCRAEMHRRFDENAVGVIRTNDGKERFTNPTDTLELLCTTVPTLNDMGSLKLIRKYVYLFENDRGCWVTCCCGRAGGQKGD
jgi:hypothetical protein